MREAVTRGEICLEDPETAIEYRVASIEYRVREDEAFRYVIAPNYSVIDLLSPPLFQGIPGLNLDLRRERYVRENRTPVFVSERAPAENREDVRKLLEAVGMEYLDKLEWLMRTDTRYGGDRLYVRRPLEGESAEPLDASSLEGGSAEAMRRILEALAAGRDVRGRGFSIDDSNRSAFHALLRALYLRDAKVVSDARAVPRAQAKSVASGAGSSGAGSGSAGAGGTGRGRKRKPVDEIRYEYAVRQFEEGRITADEAAKKAGVSRATFFRRLKEERGA